MASCKTCNGSGTCKGCGGKGCNSCYSKRNVAGGWGGTYGNGDCAQCRGTGQK